MGSDGADTVPGLPLVPRRQPGRARVHRVQPGAAGEERVLPAVLGPAVRRPRLGRDGTPGGRRPGRGRREDRPSPAVLRPDGTAHPNPAGASRAAPPAQGPPPGSRLGPAGAAVAARPPGPPPAGHVAEVLRQAGMLHDDRRPAFDAWLDRKLDGVSAGIRRDAERWLRTLKDGGPRSRPRRIATVHSHLAKALPALLDWSSRYHHLREVTRGDIQDHVRGMHGSRRHNALVALRSLFGFCLSAGVIFRDPARGIKVGRRPSGTVLQPLGQEDIDDAVAASATPAARLIVALAGVHAARSSTICAMLLSDADPGSGRLLLGGKPRPLGDLTARLLRAWLEARRARWPGTANPHLLINAQTALGTEPVSRTWACSALRGHAATIEALRVDRQLEEALATGADPLHLAATFGLDPGRSPANPRTRSAQED